MATRHWRRRRRHASAALAHDAASPSEAGSSAGDGRAAAWVMGGPQPGPQARDGERRGWGMGAFVRSGESRCGGENGGGCECAGWR